MSDSQQQVDLRQRPDDVTLTRHVLVGYGHQLKKMPASTLKTYREMERDYTVGMCLGLLSFPIIASQWSIEVKDAGADSGADSTEKSPVDATEIQQTLTDMVTPIWRDTVKHLLTALSRKAAPAEKRFQIRDGRVWLKCIDPVRLEDAELLLIEDEIDGQKRRGFGGMSVRVPGARLSRQQQEASYGPVAGKGPDLSVLAPDRVPLPAWRTLWFAIDSADGELCGESIRMERAKRSWWSKASEGGLLDVEDIWFRQRVTDPVEVYYREGTRPNGRNNAEVALDIGQSYQAHGVICTPLGPGQTPDNCDFVVKKPEGQKESKQIPQQIDQSIDPRILFAFCIAPLVGGAKQDVGAYSLGEVLVKFLLWNIEDIGEQVTQALTKWVLQPIVDWNWGDRWVVTLKCNSLAPDVVALLREIVKGLFGGAHAGKFIGLLDLGSALQEAGLTLADDADERIDQIREQLAGGGMGLADQLAQVIGDRRALSPTNGTSANGHDGQPAMPEAVAARLRAVDRSLDQRTDEASTAALSFWAALEADLKKKTPETASSGRN